MTVDDSQPRATIATAIDVLVVIYAATFLLGAMLQTEGLAVGAGSAPLFCL